MTEKKLLDRHLEQKLMGQECYNPINVQVNGFLSLPHLVSTRM